MKLKQIFKKDRVNYDGVRDFLRNAPTKEKERVFGMVAERASEEQRQLLKRAVREFGFEVEFKYEIETGYQNTLIYSHLIGFV